MCMAHSCICQQHHFICRRWLLLHNYTLSVPEVYNMINRPALKNSSEMAIMANSSTNAGSIENYMYYLQVGAWPCCQHHKELKAEQWLHLAS